MKHWGADFAVRLSHWIGYRRPLVRRLRDPAIEKTQAELEYAANIIAGETERLRGNRNSMVDRRKHLRVAATFLELHIYQKIPRKKAVGKAGDRHGISDRAVEASLDFAMRLTDPDGGPWTWWAIANRLARKGKITKLRRMY
jgi:hypothetical protein